MKKIAALLLLYLIAFPAASQGISDSFYLKKFKKDYFVYSDGVEYNLICLTHSGISNVPIEENDYTYYKAPGDKKYKDVSFKFRNNSEEDQIIDFSEFFLVDKHGQIHKAWNIIIAWDVSFCGDTHAIKTKIKAGKAKTITIQFWPAFPKDEFPTVLIVKDRTIKLEDYLKNKL